jgi:colanic acid/amylovoran biosynthesis glycosyltransferase
LVGSVADTAKVTRLYNGLELGRLAYREPRERQRLVLGVGRLVEKKGFADLVDACALLAARGSEFLCRIVGTGDQEAALRAQIRRLGVEDHVRLLGARPQSEVFELIQGAAVLAAPCVVGTDSNRDGLPTVLLEAMALGTPCVSTDVTGIPEAVRHGQTGLIVPQHDPARLAEGLGQLLDGPAERVRLAAAARRHVEAEFDATRNSARLREIFAASRRRPSGIPEEDGNAHPHAAAPQHRAPAAV